MTHEQLAAAIVAHMREKQYTVDTEPGHLNIVYIEGMNLDLSPNDNPLDGWNDLSLLIDHDLHGQPFVAFIAEATTEPGRGATMSLSAGQLGGVARIQFGQFLAWKMGFHRNARYPGQHPALVQCAELLVHRDHNKDGKRDGDPIRRAHGINQHGTSATFSGIHVGFHSAGCLVRKWWDQHLTFIRHLQDDPRYKANKNYVFGTTILPARVVLPPA